MNSIIRIAAVAAVASTAMVSSAFALTNDDYAYGAESDKSAVVLKADSGIETEVDFSEEKSPKSKSSKAEAELRAEYDEDETETIIDSAPILRETPSTKTEIHDYELDSGEPILISEEAEGNSVIEYDVEYDRENDCLEYSFYDSEE